MAQLLREIKQEVAAGADVPAEQTYEVEHLRGHRHTPEGLSLRVVWHPTRHTTLADTGREEGSAEGR